MIESLGMLGFLSIFHIGGGIAIGATFRQWLHGGFSLRQPFLLFWGALFGGIPFLIGLGLFSAQGTLYLIAAELGIFLLAIGVTALIPGWFIESFDMNQAMPILIGGLFLLVGFGVGISTWRTETGTALIMMCLFGGVGALVCVLGIVEVFKRS